MQNNLKRTRITLDELTCYLRQRDILDPRQVQYAILETNGNLSVFPYAAQEPASAKEAGIQVKDRHLPITIISDGKLIRDNLTIARKDPDWVQKILKQKDATIADTFFLAVDSTDRVIFYRKEC